MTTPDDHEVEEHDLGLAHDLPIIVEQERRSLGRRGLLGIMGGVGAVALVGCADDTETAAGTGAASGVAEGVPVTVNLKVYDLNGATVTALPGAAIYLWHCDREGRYSLYSDGVTEENYLRGVQEADADGNLTFTSIFPACYAGRWPHMHFEVYESLDSATSYTNKLRTSQLALPQDVCDDVYANVEGYEQSVSNLAQLSLDTDGIFSDGYSLQMASVTGSVDEGYTISLNVPV